MTKTKLDKSGYNHLSQHHKNYAFELIGIEQKLNSRLSVQGVYCHCVSSDTP
jgi:hypothetical protein